MLYVLQCFKVFVLVLTLFLHFFLFSQGEDPSPITFDPPPLPDGNRIALPILVMAGNRPQYLYRMLKTLSEVQGLIPSMVTVFIDGFFDEPRDISRMLGLRVDQHEGVSEKNARIAQVCIIKSSNLIQNGDFSNLD